MIALSTLFIILIGAVEAAAQPARPEVRAHRLAEGETLVIDGAPDEAAWQKAIPATNFLQRDPDNGAPATEKTEVRVLFDRDRLILGVICFDSEPTRLLGNQMQRDQSFGSDDRFMFPIDPFNDGRTGYFFEINPSGAMGDGLITGPTGSDWGGGGGGLWRRDGEVVGRHLAGARAPHRHRLDRGGRDPVQDLELQSRRRDVGRQLSAHRAAQERRKPVDRIAARRRADAHVECRPHRRHHRHLARRRSRSEAVRARCRQRGARTRRAGDEGRLGDRPRRLLQRDAGAEVQLFRQHRLRGNRSGRAPDQSDALPAVLRGEARVLSRRRQLLRISRR